MDIVMTLRTDDDDTADRIVTPIVEAAAESIRRILIEQNVWSHIDVEVDGTRVRF